MKKRAIILGIAILTSLSIESVTLFSHNSGRPAVVELRGQVDKLNQEKHEIQQKINTLQARKKALESYGYEREQIIRSELGLIHEDEVQINLTGVKTK